MQPPLHTFFFVRLGGQWCHRYNNSGITTGRDQPSTKGQWCHRYNNSAFFLTIPEIGAQTVICLKPQYRHFAHLAIKKGFKKGKKAF
jgi:hypothetical protein